MFRAKSSLIQFYRLLNVSHGNIDVFPKSIKQFIETNAKLCQPESVYICDGSDHENDYMSNKLVKDGVFTKLTKYQNCWYSRSDPRDVARVESKTVISTPKKSETIPEPKPGVKGTLGFWWSPEEMEKAKQDRFPGCMKGRTMYVIPYSMGPVGSPLSKYGIQCTDSEYVVASMRIMTRMGSAVLPHLDDSFIKCLHSVGQPLPMKTPPVNNWPCCPEKVMVAHIPAENSIISYGSGYGGNALLGKKCFALRLGSILARDEGWMAEHMLILGITNPKGSKKYITAAFPSQCGKTNLAMMEPSIDGFKVECVGDDIAWMRFVKGDLRAINPEAGFFGVCPGTSNKSNPMAMRTMFKNSIFTNTAITADGGVWWEGMESKTDPKLKITSWLGNTDWKAKGEKAAHSNSRFTTPARQCPIMDPKWEDASGVPVSAFLFGGRRPKGVPLVYEAFNWKHGVLIGAAMRSEATSAAEFKGKAIMHDPFAMRPFFGYNFGNYVRHWLSMDKDKRNLPRIFHVNWFRTDDNGKFLWPGFGDNSRVLDWVLRRCDGEDVAIETPIGYVPKPGTINFDGMEEKVDHDALFNIPKDMWLEECEAIRKYFHDQVGNDLPNEMWEELDALEDRVKRM